MIFCANLYNLLSPVINVPPILASVPNSYLVTHSTSFHLVCSGINAMGFSLALTLFWTSLSFYSFQISIFVISLC